MGKEQKSKYREKYKPDNFVYVLIIIILAIVRFVPLSLGSSEFDDAINDLAVGGCASALVAWLIDVANCSKKNKELHEKKRMIFAEYRGAINDLVSFIVRRCEKFSNDTDELNVESWLSKLSDKTNYPEGISPAITMSRAYFHIGVYVRNIKSTLNLLRQQYCMLVESNIVDTDDLHRHIALQMRICDDICDALELSQKDYSNVAEFVNENIIELHGNAKTLFSDNISEKYSLQTKG